MNNDFKKGNPALTKDVKNATKTKKKEEKQN